MRFVSASISVFAVAERALTRTAEQECKLPRQPTPSFLDCWLKHLHMCEAGSLAQQQRDCSTGGGYDAGASAHAPESNLQNRERALGCRELTGRFACSGELRDDAACGPRYHLGDSNVGEVEPHHGSMRSGHSARLREIDAVGRLKCYVAHTAHSGKHPPRAAGAPPAAPQVSRRRGPPTSGCAGAQARRPSCGQLRTPAPAQTRCRTAALPQSAPQDSFHEAAVNDALTALRQRSQSRQRQTARCSCCELVRGFHHRGQRSEPADSKDVLRASAIA